MNLAFCLGRASLTLPLIAFAAVIESNAATIVVSNVNDSGPGSLRQAIIDANATNGLDTIVFQIPGPGPFSIAPGSALPAISDSVMIDGTTQPGFASSPLIELNGTSAGNNGGLRLISGTNSIRGLCINRFGAGGIRLEGFGNNVIQGNYIGTDVTGALGLGNGQSGILVNNSPANTIGGVNPGERNVISANADTGVYLLTTTSNLVIGNYIGTTTSGAARLGNANNGIALYGAADNVIGGTTAGARNVISGNQGSGIYLFGDTANENLIQGNYIGTDLNGTTAISNAADGITLSGANSNTIGGQIAGAANLISGNGEAGISFSDVKVGNNVVAGNFIGTDASGLLPIGNTYAGLTLENSTNNTIGGVSVAARNLISGNRQDGIFMTNSGLNTVQGNWIGIVGNGNGSLQNYFNGISISRAGPNTIGGTNSGAGNLISGNANYGIEIFSGSTGNLILGNFIGPNPAATLPVRNLLSGIRIESSGNTVGGPAAGARNVISGNGEDGVLLTGPAASNNVVQGNYVGTNPNGNAPLRNGRAGVGISGAPKNLIGGAGPGQGNVLSGNTDAGVYILGSVSAGNQVLGNKLGTDPTGTIGVGNLYEGVYLDSASSNTIGGATAGAGNIISGNFTRGVFLFTNSWWNVIQGNLIGTKADGSSGLGNTFHSVECESNACNNFIGGPGAAGNRIGFAQTVYAGVRIRYGATNNLIRGNGIFSNGALGIDLSDSSGAPGVNPNDACDADAGANNLQNFPVITQACAGTEVLVRGTLNSTASRTFLLQFFGSPSCDSSGNGEGQIPLGETTVTTSNNCNSSFVATLPTPMPPGYVVTATATDPSNNTSEFSACTVAGAIPTLSIARTSNTQVSLAWPTNATGFVLKETTALTQPILWSIVTTNPPVQGGQFVVTRSFDALVKFYYLAWQ